MGIEIERKFLVGGDGWRRVVQASQALRQGYLASGGGVTVRVRMVDNDRAYLTIKGGAVGLARAEFEYEVPVEDARQMLELCHGTEVAKVRHTLDLPGGDWVVDEFRGRHEGLVLAEVELESETSEFDRPDWLGDEVTGDPQYYNSSLAALPDGGEI